MRFATNCTHAGEGYLPDTLKVQPHDPKVEGYGYNDPAETEYDDVVIEADNLDACYALWLEYAVGCSAIRGADDDHYDYFPSNFSALVHLGLQIDQARGSDRCITLARFIWDQLAFQRWDASLETSEQADANFDSEIHPRP